MGLCRSTKGAAAPAGDPNTIIAVEDDGSGYAQFITEGPHGLANGDFVDISGTEIYDGSLYEYREPEPMEETTKFRLVDCVFGGSATGSWTLVEI